MLKILQKLKWIDLLLVVGILFVAVGVGFGIKDGMQSSKEVIKTEVVEAKNDTKVSSKVTIDIEGEVINPGIYRLDNESRVSDVLVASGGLALKADRDWVQKNLNKAELVTDGQKIFIPKVGDSNINSDKGVSQYARTDMVISLNSAGLEELDKLNGVGPSIAQRIIDYRTENGGFKNIEEIKLVPGIGDKMYEKIKSQIKL